LRNKIVDYSLLTPDRFSPTLILNIRITYTRHIEKKLKEFKKSGIIIPKTRIKEVVTHPIHIDTTSDYPKIIASGRFDKKHILRVVYKREDDIIIIITCYLAKKGRYFIYENEN